MLAQVLQQTPRRERKDGLRPGKATKYFGLMFARAAHEHLVIALRPARAIRLCDALPMIVWCCARLKVWPLLPPRTRKVRQQPFTRVPSASHRSHGVAELVRAGRISYRTALVHPHRYRPSFSRACAILADLGASIVERVRQREIGLPGACSRVKRSARSATWRKLVVFKNGKGCRNRGRC